MKSIKILAAVLIAALVATGCKKVVDTSPFNSISDVSAFQSADRCLLVLNGVYDAAQTGVYPGGSRGYPFGAANIEQGDNRGEDVINIAAFYAITYTAAYNTTTANNVNMWTSTYFLINRANLSIDGFTKASGGVLTAATATQYIAECRFLRAMGHHELLTHFARPYLDNAGKQPGIPYRETPVNSSEAVASLTTVPRMRVDSVYAKILADLDFAEANLPATGLVYRATKGAAIALKMRIKLHMGDWAGVIAEGAKLVPATLGTTVTSPIGGYSLPASPELTFANNNAGSSESMFSIKNDALDNPNTNGSLARMYSSTNVTGRGLVPVSPVIWNNAGWLCTDKRRTLLYQSGINSNGATTNVNYFTTKYKDVVNQSDYAPQVRYAEVLLTLAEAESRNAAGVSPRAIALLNVVRNRSLANPAAEAYVTFASKNAVTGAILLERRIEFLCEGKRWADIHRNATDPDFNVGGIPAKAVPQTQGIGVYVCGGGYTPGQAAIPYSDYRFIWPINADEIAANPIIAQNPGY